MLGLREKLLRSLLMSPILIGSFVGAARADFAGCVEQIKQEASHNGVSSGLLSKAFSDVSPDPKVLDLENYQPEFKTPIWDYMASMVDDERVKDGKAAMSANSKALALAEERFGVSRYAVAAIWGVESDFGHQIGDRPLIQSLATLACTASKRPRYFRGELMATLKIADRGDIPLDKLKGSWAGAFGQTQFMPSTFLRLAVDLDGSGRDIIDNSAAALGSTANYLHKSGWRTGEGWIYEVKLPQGYSGPSGRRDKHPMSFWKGRGLTRMDGQALGEGSAGLLLPTGANGPAFLVTSNFDAIYSYNPSESYALAVAILAHRLAGGSEIETPWPTDDPGLSRAGRRELQELLVKRGYDVGTPDGVIGTKSHAAIAEIQGKNGMRADGRASQKVLDLLRQ